MLDGLCASLSMRLLLSNQSTASNWRRGSSPFVCSEEEMLGKGGNIDRESYTITSSYWAYSTEMLAVLAGNLLSFLYASTTDVIIRKSMIRTRRRVITSSKRVFHTSVRKSGKRPAVQRLKACRFSWFRQGVSSHQTASGTFSLNAC